MKNPQHFNDEFDDTNDDGYYHYSEGSTIPQEWLDEEEQFFSESTLDPADPDEYDPVQGEDGEPADHLDRYDDDFDWDDETPIGLEYDTYNDADNY